MKVTEFLKKVASGTGLITFADATKVPELPTIQTQSMSLAELQQRFAGTRQESAEFSIPFETLFQAMKVPSYAHGWSAESVRKYIQSDDVARMSSDEKKATVLRVLQENKVPLEDIVVDAVRRDEALDAYERFAEKKLQEKQKHFASEIARLESEIKQHQSTIRSLNEQKLRATQDFDMWLTTKTAHEEDLVRVVSFVTNESKISVGSVTNNKR